MNQQETISPQCAYFGRCGGCSYQDLTYDTQLRLKHGDVINAFETFQANHAFDVLPVIPSPKPFQYRRMISMSVRKRQGKLTFGFMGRQQDNGDGKRFFVPIEKCAIADECLNAFFPRALEKLESLPPKRKYRTSQIVLRADESGDVVTSLRTDRGRTLTTKISNRSFTYSVSSFFQHNASVLEPFVSAVRELLAPNPNTVLFDLYSGVGLFSILLAPDYCRVCGIEEGYEAVRHAEDNAWENGVRNAVFRLGKVENELPMLAVEPAEEIHAIVDPPRAGLKPEVIDALKEMPIKKLVYVSCSLEALVRNLKLLEDRFCIACVQPIDLFPQTAHIETLVLLKPS